MSSCLVGICVVGPYKIEHNALKEKKVLDYLKMLKGAPEDAEEMYECEIGIKEIVDRMSMSDIENFYKDFLEMWNDSESENVGTKGFKTLGGRAKAVFLTEMSYCGEELENDLYTKLLIAEGTPIAGFLGLE